MRRRFIQTARQMCQSLEYATYYAVFGLFSLSALKYKTIIFFLLQIDVRVY